MNVSNVQPPLSPTSGVQAADGKRAELQMMILRKALDAQKDQAAELMRQFEGKGQMLDVRV